MAGMSGTPWRGRESYKAYLQSEEWKARRQHAIDLADGRCQVCYSPDDLEVHHRTYERLFEEAPLDLTVLCRDCHGLYHQRLAEHDDSGGPSLNPKAKRERLWLSK